MILYYIILYYGIRVRYVCVWYVCDCMYIWCHESSVNVGKFHDLSRRFRQDLTVQLELPGPLSAQDLELAVSSQLLDLSLPIQFRTCWVNDFFRKFTKWSLNVVNPPEISGSGESTSDLSVGAVVNI